VRHNSGMQAPEDRDGFAIVRVDLEDGGVCMEAIGTAEAAACPSCGAMAAAVHGQYQRHPRDLPWRRWHVRLTVTVRRFRCPNPACPRTTFAETFGTGLPRYARRTAEVTDALQTFALGAGGEAGARLAAKARLPTSPDTLLRLIRQADVATVATPRVLGVDDFALRRGHRYGTLLIDLESHRPVDVLDERTAEGLATWLKTHPGVEVIARDRAEAYAEGARAGAPDAVQVADRFHLVQNASAALDEVLRGRKRHLEVVANAASTEVATDPGPALAVAPPPPSRAEQRRRAARARRVARWEEVRARHAAGETLSGIARELGLDRKTVRRWLHQPDPPAAKGRSPRPPDLPSPSLQPYLRYLQERWQAGCTNISQLYREIAAQGFTKSRSLVAQALLAWRGPRPAPAPRRPDGSWRRGRPRQRRLKVRWLCLRPPEQLAAEERAALDRVLTEDATLKTGYDLLQRFRQVVADRDVAALGPWLADAQASDVAPFVTLARGIVADRAAVEAALTTPWSTGPVEGHVHRVKLLKRQHYGRAKLDLLRARVLRN
jgi:transposase